MENLSEDFDSKDILQDLISRSDIICMQDLYKDFHESETVMSEDRKNSNDLLKKTIEEEKVDISKENRTRKQRRKPSTPRRGPTRYDPNFRGVRFCLQTYLEGDDSHLMISAHFSNVKAGFQGMSRKHNSGSGSPPCWTGSDDENLPHFVKESLFTAKACASCRTRRTPLWRDADDGTPLCNACGIRFKKYRIRCSRCWHIPKKEVKTFPNCPTCGCSLRMPVPRRNW